MMQMFEAAPTLAFLGNISPIQWAVIGIVALLVFGKRLPDVGRSLGRGLVEFKKGLQGVHDEIESASKDAKDLGKSDKRLEETQARKSTGGHVDSGVSETVDRDPTESKTPSSQA